MSLPEVEKLSPLLLQINSDVTRVLEGFEVEYRMFGLSAGFTNYLNSKTEIIRRRFSRVRQILLKEDSGFEELGLQKQFEEAARLSAILNRRDRDFGIIPSYTQILLPTAFPGQKLDHPKIYEPTEDESKLNVSLQSVMAKNLKTLGFGSNLRLMNFLDPSSRIVLGENGESLDRMRSIYPDSVLKSYYTERNSWGDPRTVGRPRSVYFTRLEDNPRVYVKVTIPVKDMEESERGKEKELVRQGNSTPYLSLEIPTVEFLQPQD